MNKEIRMVERNVKCYEIDLENDEDSEAMVYLLNRYALDIMGGGEPLSDDVRATLPSALRKRSSSFNISSLFHIFDHSEHP